jgi:hypothetical protein
MLDQLLDSEGIAYVPTTLYKHQPNHKPTTTTPTTLYKHQPNHKPTTTTMQHKKYTKDSYRATPFISKNITQKFVLEGNQNDRDFELQQRNHKGGASFPIMALTRLTVARSNFTNNHKPVLLPFEEFSST